MSTKNQKEKDFEKKFIEEIKAHTKAWVMPKDTMPTVRGAPDRVVCCNGVFVALEFKKSISETDKPRVWLQKHSLKEIEKCGGIGLMVYPENRNQAIEKILEVCYGN